MKIQVKNNLTAAVKIGTSRQVVIPKPIHDSLGLRPGDYLQVELTPKREVVLKPQTLIDKQIYEAVAESMKDYREGRYYGPFDTAEEMIKSLHRGLKQHKKAKRR